MTHYPIPPSFRRDFEPPPATEHSMGGLCACGFGALGLMCIIGGVVLSVADPVGRRQMVGFLYFLLMYLPPLLLCPIGLVCALFGVTQTEKKRTFAWVGLVANVLGLAFWIALRAYVRRE